MIPSPRVADIGGVPVHALSLGEAAGRLVEAASQRSPFVVHLCNAYVISLASRDERYAAVLRAGDLNLADGAPVAWTLRRLGAPLDGARPSGAELFAEVFARSAAGGLRHYLYGSSPATVKGLVEEVRQRWPGATLVGADSPPYRPLTGAEYEDLVSRIRASGAEIVWIGIGTPKQDLLVERLRHDVSAVLIPVGAAFDFLAGEKRRAPSWMRRLGLEWVHRLFTEPRRLWRRYLVGNLVFLAVARRARLLGPGS